MLKVIIGEKGTGKTKALLEGVHKAVDIERGNRHIYDLNYRIRLVDSADFGISNYSEVYGLISGIISQDFDTSHVFIDSLTKIATGTVDELVAFLNKFDELTNRYNITATVTISMNEKDMPEAAKKYCTNNY